MSKKLEYNYVKDYIENEYENKLLSKEYINGNTPLIIQCKCGNIYKRTFHKFASGQIKCPKCSIEKRSKSRSLSLENVKKIISSAGCEYISGEYRNLYSKLIIRCKCGNTFKKDLSHFQRGQTQCPKCGLRKLSEFKTKYSRNDAIDILNKRGYCLIGDYINANANCKCICPNGHIVNIKLSYFILNHSGCKKCANNGLMGANHWNYKGGESEVLDFFRKHIVDWKKSVMKNYNYSCYLTGSKKDLVIHHIKSFNTIVSECCKKLKLPLHNKINEYTKNDFDILTNLVLSSHKTEYGVVLQRKVHNKFHSLYGKGNNTLEQLNDFIQRYYPEKELIIN